MDGEEDEAKMKANMEGETTAKNEKKGRERMNAKLKKETTKVPRKMEEEE